MDRNALSHIHDDAVLDGLREVIDPEIGINIVDLGLVYSAARKAGSVKVELTLTSRACPLGELMIAEARTVLERRFPEHAQIDIHLVWEPPWHPDLITDEGRQMLGHS